MGELKCSDCVWGNPVTQSSEGNEYQMIECHYHPAVVLPPIIATLDSMPINAIEAIMDNMRPLTAWPIVKPDDFCAKGIFDKGYRHV